MTAFDTTVAALAEQPEKVTLARKIAHFFREKHANPDMRPPIKMGLSDVTKDILKNVAGAALIGGGGYLAGKALDRWDESGSRLDAERKQLGELSGQQRFRNEGLQKLVPLHTQVEQGLHADPQFAKLNNPELVKSTYNTMRRFAPYLAADPTIARSFVEMHVLSNQPPSYATMKTLADAEQSVNKAGVMEI
jgi:hypothetical protein